MSLTSRSLGNDADFLHTSFTKQQNRSVLIAGLTCACFSVIATLITLRWFLLMKRTFRHSLIMFLIFSDTFKAFWYFLFPIVVFSRGPISSSSRFCQVSGFFLAFGIEASDFAILMIALHSIIYIFRPPARVGDSGGLYRYRKAIYPFWALLPLLAASLAFINQGNAYQTAGTFCYLPRRPFWYRLALAWIPRYCIILLIFGMYAAVYIYVAVKFRSFSNLQLSGSSHSSRSHSRRTSFSDDEIAPDEPPPKVTSTKKFTPRQSRFSRISFLNNQEEHAHIEPWDRVDFVTSTTISRHTDRRPVTKTMDFANESAHSGLSVDTAASAGRGTDFSTIASLSGSRKVSQAATMNSEVMDKTANQRSPSPQQTQTLSQAVQSPQQAPPQVKPTDPLKLTRRAIQKQLRYLFIYPAVYVLMWVFPFVSHCLLYDDYYVRNPIYWLSVTTTCMISSMAGVDCIVFSWREKPWRRIPDNRKFSFASFRSSFSQGKTKAEFAESSVAAGANAELGALHRDSNAPSSGPSRRVISAHWWEAEGKKRKDSVWMGTDADRRGTVAHTPELSPVVSRSDEDGHREQLQDKVLPQPEAHRVPNTIPENDEAMFSTLNWNR